MKVMITGAAGQLGQALQRTVPLGMAGQSVELILCSRRGGDGAIALDLADAAACRALVQQIKPDWLINAGAYTAVDRAEAEPELARAVNALAPQAFAQALESTGGRMLQLSTDFVFNGCQGKPYEPAAAPAPLGVYGATKAQGELAVLDRLAGAGRVVVLRTGWVYGPVGHNFLLTMLRLLAEREQLGVVADQVGCPTATAGLAKACWQVLARVAAVTPGLSALLHWSDAGVASWYDFAMAIRQLALDQGLLMRAATVQPLTTPEYPTPARRPSYSLLDCSDSRAQLGLAPRHWRQALAVVMSELSGMTTPEVSP